VGEILIGLSGNSVLNRKEALEAAFRSLSKRERRIIEESDNQKKFQEEYAVRSKANQLDKMPPALLADVKGIVARVEKEKLYRGKGGEIMREGVCHLIYSMSVAKLDFGGKELLALFMTVVENLKHPNIEI